MFEVGFGEILMLALVTLLVVGPEQIPKVARTAGLWLGRARRLMASVRSDIERELRAEEMKEFLQQQKLKTSIDELIESSKNSLDNSHYTSSSSMATAPNPIVTTPVTPIESSQTSTLNLEKNS